MISVVIPAYNEEGFIAKCLESFLHQTTQEPFEIILVDNASTDGTYLIAQTYMDQLPLQIVKEEKKGRGNARSKGFAIAQGDIVLSTDSDGYVPDDWIECMSKSFTDNTVIAVTGPVRVHDLGWAKGLLVKAGVPFAMYFYRMLYGYFWLTGSNFAIRKHIYDQSGGFAHVNGLEDIELSVRIAKIGKITYRPIWVWTSGRRFFHLQSGFSDYFKAYIDFFWKKDRTFYFPDNR